MRLAVGILIAGVVMSANAGIIFSNLGADDTFATSGWVVGNRNTPFGSISLEIAAAFTPASDAVFTGADFAAQLFGNPGDLIVALRITGPFGLIGTALETFTVPAPMVPSLVSVSSSSNLLLSAETQYWLDISSLSTDAVWLDNDQGARGPMEVNQNHSGFVPLTDFAGNLPIQPAFRINGDPAGSSFETFAVSAAAAEAPEPASFVVVFGALLLLPLIRVKFAARRRR